MNEENNELVQDEVKISEAEISDNEKENLNSEIQPAEELEVNEDVQEELENDGSTENEELVQEKPLSTLSIFFRNLNYRLSYTPALGFVSIMSLVCVLGLIFFIYERNMFIDKPDVVGACVIFIVFFSLASLLFVTLFVSSIVLNIIRIKQGKR